MDKFSFEQITEIKYLPAFYRDVKSHSILIPAHFHDFMEVLYIIKGELHAVISANSYVLKSGDIFIVSANAIHKTEVIDGTVEYLLLQISSERLKSMIPNVEAYRISPVLNLHQKNDTSSKESYLLMKHHLLQMQNLYSEKQDGFQLLFSMELYGFLHTLFYQSCAVSLEQINSLASIDSAHITKVMNWTKINFNKNISLADAAEYLHISKEYLARLFKKYTGQTYLEYLNSIRMISFHELLLSCDEPVSKLLAECGITNEKVFRKNYKQQYGCTPLKARKSLRT